MIENTDVHGLNGFLSHKREKTKKCPKCSSVFLTDSECEACGFQLNFNFVGEPFGHLSFYTAREKFHSTGTLRKLAYYFYGNKYRRYKKYELTLKRRFSNLLTYFFEHIDPGEERRKFFFFELSQLVEEMKELGLSRYISSEVKDRVMSSDVENFSDNSVYVSKITSWINHREINNKRKAPPLTIKVFGAIRVGYIMAIMITTLLVISFGLMSYPYFLY